MLKKLLLVSTLCVSVLMAYAESGVTIPASNSGSTSTKYQFRFDDAVLGQHVKENTDGNDQRSREFTYSVWVKPADAQGYVMGHGQALYYTDPVGSIDVKYEGSNLIAAVRTAHINNVMNVDAALTMTTVYGADATLPAGEWAFVTITANDEAVRVYKNGSLISEGYLDTDYRIGLLHDECVFYVGKNDFSGDVEGAAVWTRALSQDEVRASMRAIDTTDASLVAYYPIYDYAGGTVTTISNQCSVYADNVAFVSVGDPEYVYNWAPPFYEPSAYAATLVEPHTFPTATISINYVAGVDVTVTADGSPLTLNWPTTSSMEGVVDLFTEVVIKVSAQEGYTLNGWSINDSSVDGETQTLNIEGDINVVIYEPTGIDGVESEKAALYYDNGAIYTNAKGEIAVYNITGKLVKQATVAPVSVNDLANGVYVVKTQNGTLKFVK